MPIETFYFLSCITFLPWGCKKLWYQFVLSNKLVELLAIFMQIELLSLLYDIELGSHNVQDVILPLFRSSVSIAKVIQFNAFSALCHVKDTTFVVLWLNDDETWFFKCYPHVTSEISPTGLPLVFWLFSLKVLKGLKQLLQLLMSLWWL